MAKLDFENFSFEIKNEELITTYGLRYKFVEPISVLRDIDPDFKVEKKSLEFPNTSEKTAENKVNRIFDNGLANLTHKLNKKKVIYIEEDSGIPLIGSGEFGVVDRNTSILEIKPLTGCNFSCTYCSVDEGINNKTHDILIDPYYLAQEVGKISSLKHHPVECNIGPHGEPFLYPFMVELVRELKKQPNVDVISVNTNGSLLNEKLLDDIYEAGMTRINLSLNSLDQESLDRMKGDYFPLKHILNMVDYCREKNYPILIAPLIVPTFNADPVKDIEPLIKLAKTLKSPYPTIGFQKFLPYKGGRNPVKKEQSFDDFFNLLKPFEEKYDVILTPRKDYNPFEIYEDKVLEKPMLKNQKIKVDIICKGRVPSETICKAHDRIVTVRGLDKLKGSTTVKIIRDKHNIFMGVPL